MHGETLKHLYNISEHGYIKFFKSTSEEGLYLCICMEIYFLNRVYLCSLSAEKSIKLFSLNTLYKLAILDTA